MKRGPNPPQPAGPLPLDPEDGKRYLAMDLSGLDYLRQGEVTWRERRVCAQENEKSRRRSRTGRMAASGPVADTRRVHSVSVGIGSGRWKVEWFVRAPTLMEAEATRTAGQGPPGTDHERRALACGREGNRRRSPLGRALG
eukprot:6176730-Pleurochrysis_carterae.AAC.1